MKYAIGIKNRTSIAKIFQYHVPFCAVAQSLYAQTAIEFDSGYLLLPCEQDAQLVMLQSAQLLAPIKAPPHRGYTQRPVASFFHA